MNHNQDLNQCQDFQKDSLFASQSHLASLFLWLSETTKCFKKNGHILHDVSNGVIYSTLVLTTKFIRRWKGFIQLSEERTNFRHDLGTQLYSLSCRVGKLEAISVGNVFK